MYLGSSDTHWRSKRCISWIAYSTEIFPNSCFFFSFHYHYSSIVSSSSTVTQVQQIPVKTPKDPSPSPTIAKEIDIEFKNSNNEEIISKGEAIVPLQETPVRKREGPKIEETPLQRKIDSSRKRVKYVFFSDEVSYNNAMNFDFFCCLFFSLLHRRRKV